MKKELTAYFNEISQYPYCTKPGEADERMRIFFLLLNEICKLGFNRLRIGTKEHSQWMIDKDYSVQKYLKCHREYADFFYSHVDSPIVDSDSHLDDEIKISSPKLVWGEKEIPCIGLAAAVISDTVSISFQSDDFWKSVRFTVLLKDEPKYVFAFCNENGLKDNAFNNWLTKKLPPEIILDSTPWEKKGIKLCGDHHGKKELRELSKKLCHKNYVKEIVCSVGFAGQTKDPIVKIYDDGFIDVAYTKSDCGYALKVRTTGRNRFETVYIAEMIRKALA